MNNSDRSIRVAVGFPSRKDRPAPAETHAEEWSAPQACVTPSIDIHESPEGLVLEADLPGAEEDQLRIQLEDNVLSLHAHVASPAPGGARTVHEEYRVGDFYRSFILSDEVDRTRISAELKSGVLRLVLPKAERAKTRRIEIKS